MKSKKNSGPKNLDLNILLEEPIYQKPPSFNPYINPLISHRNKPFNMVSFNKPTKPLQNDKDKENTICFSNFTTKQKPAFIQDFQTNLNHDDDLYIKQLRGQIKKGLFSRERKRNSSVVYEKNSIFEKFKKEFLFNIENFQKILCFLDLFDLLKSQYICKTTFSPEFKSMIKKLASKCLLKGISNSQQRSYYDHFLKFDSLQRKFPLQYQLNALKPSNSLKDIQKDIDRTYHCSKHLSSIEKQQILKQVLNALANSDKEIGYIQGLNVFVSIFIWNGLSEQEIYWISKFFLEKKRLKDVMKQGFPKLQSLTYQFDVFLSNYLPEIKKHFETQGISITYFTYPWFLTLFAYELPLDLINIVWNLFLLKGWKTIIRCGLALLSVFATQILQQNSDELGDFLRSFFLHFTEQNRSIFLEKMVNFKVTNRLLATLDSLHKEGNVSLPLLKVSDDLKKLTWDLAPFYDKLTENAMNSYLKHTNSHNSKESRPKPQDTSFGFFSIMKEIFGLEKKNSRNSEDFSENNNKKSQEFKKEKPFFKKSNTINHLNNFPFHINKGMIPDFTQINPILLHSETEILPNESVLS